MCEVDQYFLIFFFVVDYVYESVAGTTLFVLIHSFLCLPSSYLYNMLDPAFMNMFSALNKLNNLSPACSIVQKLEFKWPYPGPQGRDLLVISRKLFSGV